jgi:hypothetical protein
MLRSTVMFRPDTPGARVERRLVLPRIVKSIMNVSWML